MAAIDIPSYIKESAISSYVTREKVRREDVQCDISWDRVKPSATIELSNVTESSSSQAIFSGSYSNPTSAEVVHNIKLDAATDATSTFNFESGQTKDLPFSFSAALPDQIASSTNAFGRSIRLDTNVGSSTRIEKIKWAVDSQVPNRPNTNVEANVQVTNKCITGKFSGKAVLEGTAVVNIRNREGKVLSTMDYDMRELMNYIQDTRVTQTDRALTWALTGTCNFVFGVKHSVQLKEL